MYANSFVESIGRLWVTFPFHVVATAFMLKFLSVLIYGSLLFLGVILVKSLTKRCGAPLGVRASYYSWYVLLLAVPLSYLDFNIVFKLPVYGIFEAFASGEGEGVWLATTLLTAAWILVLLYRLEAFIIQNVRLEGAVRLLRPANVGNALEKAIAAFKLSTKRIRAAQADWVVSPLTYGVIRKTILLPRGFENKYGEDELYYLLLHEMAHIKNGDMEKLFFIRLFDCLFMVPPGFLRAFRRDSEILCDNRVLGASNISAHRYGELLVDACSGAAAPIKGLAFSDSFRLIKARVWAVMHSRPVRHRLSVFAVIMALCFIGAFVWAWNVPAKWYRDSHPGNLDVAAAVIFADGGSIALRPYDNVFYYSDDGYRLYYDYDALNAVYEEIIAGGSAPVCLRVEISGYSSGTAAGEMMTKLIAFPLTEELKDNPGPRMVFPVSSEREYITRYIAHWL